MISVVIPTYNHAKTITACLDSLRRQSYIDWEAVVVNDGSADDTATVMQQYLNGISTKQISYQEIPHSGAPVARNHGAKLCKGEEIIFVDADVIMQPNMLFELHRALDSQPDASYAYPDFYFGRKLILARSFDAQALKKNNFISMMSLIRRCDFSGFDEALKRFQDWDLWLTMLEQGHRGIHVPQVLFTAQIARRGISRWRPAFWYRVCDQLRQHNLPTPQSYKEYEATRQVIIRKHHL